MNVRARLLIGAGVITCIVAVALATPIVGLNFGTILSSGTVNTEVSQHVRVALPGTTGEEQEDNQWTARLFTNGPSNFIVQDVSYAPNGHTGWHSHPGILLVSVIEGSIEWYDAKLPTYRLQRGEFSNREHRDSLPAQCRIGERPLYGHLHPCEWSASAN